MMNAASRALGAVVLAAGASRRMGRPKALLPIRTTGEPFVTRLCATLAASGIDPVVIVVRRELDSAIALAVPGARRVINDDPDRGQLSSLLAGLAALGDPEAALVTLVDLPLARVETVQALVQAWRRTGAPLVRPVHDRRHGHPVIFGAPLLAALRTGDAATGAKPIVRAFASQAIDVPVTDPGTVEDFDTPEDLSRL